MAKIIFYVLFYSLSFSISALCLQESFNPHFWTGHIVHASGGFVVDDNRAQGGIGIYLSKPNQSKVMLRGNVGFFYGYEYGWQFANHGYLGGALEWTILYPRNFLPTDEQKFTVSKKVLAWLQPLTHVRIGYVFNNHALLSLGLTYLWGLNLNFRAPLTEHLFIEAQYLQWFDGIIGLFPVGSTLGAAFDFANFSAGLGYKF